VILVTGANGFLGPHVIRSLAGAAEHGRVRALLRKPDEHFVARFPDVEVLVGDLLDEGSLAAAVEGAKTVVHLASKNVDHDRSGFGVNSVGTEKLCRAAIAAQVRRFVYVSSVGVYGHGAHREADETTPLRPDTAFSVSKAAAESVVLAHHQKGHFRGTVLRHRFVYGEGDESVLPRLIRAARKYPFWVAGGRARISLVLARDLAEVVRRFATAEALDDLPDEDPVFHVTSGEPLSYRQLISTICDAFGCRPPRVSLPLWLLVAPLLLREKLLRLDPETVEGISSLRVKMIAQDNEFSNRKLLRRFPDLDFAPFAAGLAECSDYYRRFANTG
jgi:nucleoside-diphosphate-sugar epimerase